MSAPSRRTMLRATAACAVLGAAAVVAEAAPGSDEHLLDLLHRWRRELAETERLGETDVDDDAIRPVFDAACDRLNETQDEVIATPALTLEGIALKSVLAGLIIENFTNEECRKPEDWLAISAGEDAARILGDQLAGGVS